MCQGSVCIEQSRPIGAQCRWRDRGSLSLAGVVYCLDRDKRGVDRRFMDDYTHMFTSWAIRIRDAPRAGDGHQSTRVPAGCSHEPQMRELRPYAGDFAQVFQVLGCLSRPTDTTRRLLRGGGFYSRCDILIGRRHQYGGSAAHDIEYRHRARRYSHGSPQKRAIHRIHHAHNWRYQYGGLDALADGLVPGR